MISIDNQPQQTEESNQDFTTAAYRELVRLALTSYAQAKYSMIPWGQRFILWRHDCDYSLNRALSLGRIEAEEGLHSTFFINPHDEFFNLFEKSQLDIVVELIKLGHDIGLHFDGAFYATDKENDLHKQIQREAELIEHLLGVRPAVFSFHQPTPFHLTCEADTYGGLVNCYSKRFKTEVPYCSDSNGYWRFRRLHDVLTQASDSCLQVLTHPSVWQERPMPPRQRIFRSVYGRARASMHLYDTDLEKWGRENRAGKMQTIRFLNAINPNLFELCDYLWNTEQFETLFIELWRLHERQINKLCEAVFREEWRVAASEINVFFESPDPAIDCSRLFVGVFDISLQEAVGTDEVIYKSWSRMRNQLVHGHSSASSATLENGCVYLCGIIEALANWGRAQPIGYDGLEHLGSVVIPARDAADVDLVEPMDGIAEGISVFSDERWEAFKAGVLATMDIVARND